MSVLPMATIARDKEVDGVYSSPDHDVDKADLRAWGAWVESGITAGTLSGPWEATLLALDAKLAYGDGNPGFVYAGADFGTYRKSGDSGVGSWVKILDTIPGYQFVKAVDAGAGTANAIVATSSPPVSYTSGAQVISVNIYETNTSEIVTVNFNDGGALQIKTSSGNNPAVGGLPAGVTVLGMIGTTGTTFQLLSEQASAAILAGAEAAQAAAEAAQAAAEAAAAGVNLPTLSLGDAKKYLRVNDLGTGYVADDVATQYAINIKDKFGIVANGSALDTANWQDALDYARDNSVALFHPGGRLMIDAASTFHQTVTLPGSPTAKDYFAPGLVLLGAGHKTSMIVNAISAGGTTLDLYSVTNGTFMSGGLISGVGFEEEGSGAGSHAIEYEGLWNSVFDRVRIEGMTGSAFKCNNPGDGDGKSSAHVRIANNYIRDNIGSGWTSQGGNGGVSLHTLENNYFVDNGGDAQIIIDGCIHFMSRMNSVAGSNGVPLVWIKKTNLTSQTLQFEQGEYGNDSGVHFIVDGVLNMVVDGIRHVRRLGEGNSLYGYYFTGTSGGVAKGVELRNLELEINNGPSSDPAAGGWTLLYCDIADAEISVRNPVSSDFATGNALYNIAGAGLSGKYHFDDLSGYALVRKPVKQYFTEPAVTSTITPDLLIAEWWKVVPAAGGTYTIAAPIGPKSTGTRFTITVYKTATILIEFAATYTVRDTIVTDSLTTLSFIYDGDAGSWRQE